jgi:putative transcriptional regulator
LVNHPNRSRRSDALAPVPTPDDLRALRQRAGLSQTEAAALVYATLNGYQRWEQGERRMQAAAWELLRIKLGDLPAPIPIIAGA